MAAGAVECGDARLKAGTRRSRPAALDAIADLIGSVDELPADMSVAKKKHLQATGYGRKRYR